MLTDSGEERRWNIYEETAGEFHCDGRERNRQRGMSLLRRLIPRAFSLLFGQAVPMSEDR